MRSGLCKAMAFACAVSLLVGCTRDAVGTGTSGDSTASRTESPKTLASTSDVQNADEHLSLSDGVYTLTSPDGTVSVAVDTKGEMSYSVYRAKEGQNVQWIRPSAMGITVGNKEFFKDAAVTDTAVREIHETFPLYGNQKSVDSDCVEAVLSFSGDSESSNYKLELRAYDNGIAFRYTVPGSGANRRLSERTTYLLRKDVTECWYGVDNQDYEAVIESHRPTEKSDRVITAPLTAVVSRGNGGYISIMEGALSDNYPGVNLKAEGNASYSTCFYTTPTVTAGSMTTGWRMINLADSLNDLVNNYNVYTVNEHPGELYADADWIEPGRSAWSWCTTHGAPTPELMEQYILAAAQLGYEYNVIDDGWPGWDGYKTRLARLGQLGEELNVKQLLWGAITSGTAGYNKMTGKSTVDSYLDLLEETKMQGAKIDFWWSEANVSATVLQKYILEEAAKRHLIIDFHGCNKNTGLNVTYPNELSREGVRGLENIGNSNTTNYTTYASWLNAQLYTRFLCGHADWTPGTYNAMELASLICIDSPLMVVASDPADILASPAREFIKSVPTYWDQTVVLSNSKIGALSIYAKQRDGVWFVGGIASKSRSGITVDLSEFLPADSGSYTAEIWTDGPSGMESRTAEVRSDGTVEIGSLSAGSGFAIRISKLQLSSYGGQTGTVSVTVSGDSKVRYTTDGSDPMTSSTASDCTGEIVIEQSCRLRVAIVEGDGKGTALSYRFNEISPLYRISSEISYQDGKTVVTFVAEDGVEIYYTLDGSEPGTGSAKAEGAIEITESCRLRYLAVYGGESVQGQTDVRVTERLEIPKSDIPLTDASPSASPQIGWGNAHYDSSMAPDNGLSARKISLGGSDENNGTQFDRGICSNAVSVYQYAVPEGARRFVAVAGIDDCVWANTVDRGKASARVILYFDGQEAYRTEIMRVGDFCSIEVEVPEGAAQMTVRFDDAGDGNTCDNVAIGAPGWVL